MEVDPHSFSSPERAVVKHLQWYADVDFATRTIRATASWEIDNTSGSGAIILDTKELLIRQVTLDDQQPTEYQLSPSDTILGQALSVQIKPGTKRINISYETSPEAEALQWLEPAQTAAKEHPFLYTQSQAILARSWIPCQDSPGVRITYEAQVKVPIELLPLMSATNPQQKNDSGIYQFKMMQPVPSYLLALTVGDVVFERVSARCGIYAEPSELSRAAWEFQDLEKMVATAECLYGEYLWERFDVIVLPPSFPFGGMENPRITFATPTILAGDRSLTSLIAHELAHSWSGNLVTNATWNDFWLNEGFTVYFEHRIMENLYGRDYSEMLAVLAWQDLQETIVSLKNENKYQDTCLKLHLDGRNPDEGVTDIAYNKGYFFLRSIEEEHGRERFDDFIRWYFSSNAFRSMDTGGFIGQIRHHYENRYGIKLLQTMFEDWIYKPGLPSSCPKPVSARLEKVAALLRKWRDGLLLNSSDVREWSTHEWLHFLKNLPQRLSLEEMEALDSLGNFTDSGNSEITTIWLVHVIRSCYVPAYKRLEQFLIQTGRRKFLSPLYQELLKTSEGKKWAVDVYARARPNYHFVATNTFDTLLNKPIFNIDPIT